MAAKGVNQYLASCRCAIHFYVCATTPHSQSLWNSRRTGTASWDLCAGSASAAPGQTVWGRRQRRTWDTGAGAAGESVGVSAMKNYLKIVKSVSIKQIKHIWRKILTLKFEKNILCKNVIIVLKSLGKWNSNNNISIIHHPLYKSETIIFTLRIRVSFHSRVIPKTWKMAIDILSWAPSLRAISINQRGGCLVGRCCVNDSCVQNGELNALGPPTQDPHW